MQRVCCRIGKEYHEVPSLESFPFLSCEAQDCAPPDIWLCGPYLDMGMPT